MLLVELLGDGGGLDESCDAEGGFIGLILNNRRAECQAILGAPASRRRERYEGVMEYWSSGVMKRQGNFKRRNTPILHYSNPPARRQHSQVNSLLPTPDLLRQGCRS
jgi:hypothetical protein